ncbi:MAG: nitrile hydratase subunit beta [Alphaproteobacteria bacterium]|nr:nitrile hydratase subunit beta [Alphaproteobacteria bacterium]
MNGAHDMGGMHGFGPVVAEADEPVFHAAWERRMFALQLAAGALGRWNIDMGRAVRENQPPGRYLASAYYELWLHGATTLLLQAGIVTGEELASGRSERPADPALVARRLPPERVGPALARGDRFRMDEGKPARFAPGDSVRVLNRHPEGHTRAPRYVRGHAGIVLRDHGMFVFADASAAGERVGQHCYSVGFLARELWGREAPPRDRVFVDLWDDHLEPA